MFRADAGCHTDDLLLGYVKKRLLVGQGPVSGWCLALQTLHLRPDEGHLLQIRGLVAAVDHDDGPVIVLSWMQKGPGPFGRTPHLDPVLPARCAVGMCVLSVPTVKHIDK